MTLSGKKYLTAIVVIIVYIEEVGALIATLCKYAWSNSPKKGWYILFLKELHVATVATATIIISDANDVAGVSDRVLQLCHGGFHYQTNWKHLPKSSKTSVKFLVSVFISSLFKLCANYCCFCESVGIQCIRVER